MTGPHHSRQGSFARASLGAILGACLLLPSAGAFAQSQEDQDACTPDVFRLCEDYIPNEGPIVTCLKSKGPQLSAACHAVMFRGDPAAVAATAETGARKLRKHRKKHRRAVQPQM